MDKCCNKITISKEVYILIVYFRYITTIYGKPLDNTTGTKTFAKEVKVNQKYYN